MNKRNFMNLRQSFLGALLVMAFMIIGAQQAEAQYLNSSKSMSALEYKLGQLMNAPQAEEPKVVYRSLSDFAAVPTVKKEVAYLSGVVTALKSTDNVQNAIDQNHSAYLESNPAASAVATQYRNQVIQLLEN